MIRQAGVQHSVGRPRRPGLSVQGRPARVEGHAILVARGVLPDSVVYPIYQWLGWARDPLRSVSWIQSTSFALGATWNAEEVVGWAMSLEDGQPLEGVEVSLPHTGVRGVTDLTMLVSYYTALALVQLSLQPEMQPGRVSTL